MEFLKMVRSEVIDCEQQYSLSPYNHQTNGYVLANRKQTQFSSTLFHWKSVLNKNQHCSHVLWYYITTNVCKNICYLTIKFLAYLCPFWTQLHLACRWLSRAVQQCSGDLTAAGSWSRELLWSENLLSHSPTALSSVPQSHLVNMQSYHFSVSCFRL